MATIPVPAAGACQPLTHRASVHPCQHTVLYYFCLGCTFLNLATIHNCKIAESDRYDVSCGNPNTASVRICNQRLAINPFGQFFRQIQISVFTPLRCVRTHAINAINAINPLTRFGLHQYRDFKLLTSCKVPSTRKSQPRKQSPKLTKPLWIALKKQPCAAQQSTRQNTTNQAEQYREEHKPAVEIRPKEPRAPKCPTNKRRDRDKKT